MMANIGIPGLTMLLLLMVSDQGRGDFIEDEGKLRRAFLTSYNTKVRPKFKTRINVALVLSSLNHLTIASQTMSVNYILCAVWNDTRLRWNSSEYGGLESLVTAPEDIWTPPLLIDNSVDEVGVIGGKTRDATPVCINNNGEVSWFPPSEVTVTCAMSITQFPFDTQTCSIVLLGWTYPLSEMDLEVKFMDVSDYEPNGEFELTNSSVHTKDVGRPNHYYTTDIGRRNESDKYRTVFFQVSFRRKWLFYAWNLILPIWLNAKLMTGVFLLPTEAWEKQGYCLTVLLSYVVFLTWVSDNLPPVSSGISILQLYVAINLILGSLQTMCTIWILRLYHQPRDKPLSKVHSTLVTRLLLPLAERWRHSGKRADRKATDSQSRKSQGAVHPTQSPPCDDGEVIMDRDSGKEADMNRQANKPGAAAGREAWKVTGADSAMVASLTWQEFAVLMDSVLFWVFGVLMVVLETTLFSLLCAKY